MIKLKFRRPSPAARKAMCDVASNSKTYLYKYSLISKAEELVKKITGHKYARVVNSGDSAIMAVMNILEEPFLIPDEGGWKGFIEIAKILNKKILKVPTNLGIIDPPFFEEYLDKLNDKPSALFVTSFAGYTAEQPIKKLYKICDKHDILLVEDSSGSIGDPKRKLCNASHSHIIVASTGSPKIVNVGNGGFISTNDKKILKQYLIRMIRADPITCAGMIEELKRAPDVFDKVVNAVAYLKKNIDNVFHKNKRGVNIILPSDNPKKDRFKIKKHINIEKNIIVTCPRYERINKKAISIEIKNIEPKCLSKENLDKILDLLSKLQLSKE